MRIIVDLLERFRSDERGVFAVLFGVMAIVLVAMAGAAVDYTAMETARTRVQIALDSAALGLAPEIYDFNEEELREKAEALVLERLNDPTLTIVVDEATANTGNGTLNLKGRVTVPMAFVQLVGIPSMSTRVVSEVTKSSVNLEVAVALDITGSMEHDIDSLQSALATLIPIVVNDVQEPTYSKMALAPYSEAVNVGNYAEDVRGEILPSKNVTSAAWWNLERNINNATRARPVVITTSAAHGYTTGDVIAIAGMKGMTELNGNSYKVQTITGSTTTFQLKNLDGSNVDGRDYDAYETTNNDKIKRCIRADCHVVITASSHGYSTGDFVGFTDFSSMSRLNNRAFGAITTLTNDSFVVPVAGYSNSSFNQPTTGSATGKLWCTNYGCLFQRLNATTYYKATASCVTERMTNSFDDTAPGTAPLAIHYTSSGNCAISEGILPLTSDKDDLLDYTLEDALTASGSTAGHIGTAWAWYLVSPEFADVFTGDSAPAAYDAPNTMKVVIIMTDGEYNRQYCKGVVTSAAGCSAPDGTTGTMSGPFGQAEDLCANMKKPEVGIVVYTVGFNLDEDSDAAEVLAGCASEPKNAKLADDAEGLEAAFREIGEDISDLRLSL